jgi:hypothetical protein
MEEMVTVDDRIPSRDFAAVAREAFEIEAAAVLGVRVSLDGAFSAVPSAQSALAKNSSYHPSVRAAREVCSRQLASSALATGKLATGYALAVALMTARHSSCRTAPASMPAAVSASAC